MSRKHARFQRRLAARRAAAEQQPQPEERRADPPLTGAALDRRLRELNLTADRRRTRRP